MAPSGFILTDCFTLRGPCQRSSPRCDHRCHKTARLPSGNAIRLAGGCTCPTETLASEIRTDKPRHRIIARLYNVGVGGILAQHLAKCCPCRPLQARLTALCEPCGTPPVALAGCTLRQEPARCTSHGSRLDRRAAPHRDRHSPFAPLRSGGPQVVTPVLAAVLIFVTKRGNPQCGHVCALSEISLSHSGHFVIIRVPSYTQIP